MQYCIYLRKSRADAEAEARGESETLARHETALLELAKRQKLNITCIYREIVSGETIVARPVMQQLLTEVEQGTWAGVLVMEVERLARGNTLDQGIVAQTFTFSNTLIITPAKTYNPNNEFDQEYFEFGLFMSRREYQTINRRLQRGRMASIMEGKFVGNIAPIGYVRRKLEKEKGFTLDINPEQAKIVKFIFELYTKGEEQIDGTMKRLGVSLIANKLNEMRISPAKGDRWVDSTIQGILKNPAYIGKIRWKARPTVKKMVDGRVETQRPRAKEDELIIVDGLHEAIIDNETWEIAQEFINNNRPAPVPRSKSVKNPLAGLIVCGVCGRKMLRRSYNGIRPVGLICSVSGCKNVSSQLSLVEEKVIQSLSQFLSQLKIDWNNKIKRTNSVSTDLKVKALIKLEDEESTLNKQLENLHDLLEQGIYNTDKFLERGKILSERIENVKADIKTLKSEINTHPTHDMTKIIPQIEEVIELYDKTSDPEKKNELLKVVIDKIVYTKTVNCRWHGNPDDFNLELYPKLQK